MSMETVGSIADPFHPPVRGPVQIPVAQECGRGDIAEELNAACEVRSTDSAQEVVPKVAERIATRRAATIEGR